MLNVSCEISDVRTGKRSCTYNYSLLLTGGHILNDIGNPMPESAKPWMWGQVVLQKAMFSRLKKTGETYGIYFSQFETRGFTNVPYYTSRHVIKLPLTKNKKDVTWPRLAASVCGSVLKIKSIFQKKTSKKHVLCPLRDAEALKIATLIGQGTKMHPQKTYISSCCPFIDDIFQVQIDATLCYVICCFTVSSIP